jgi:hypothetical protein
MTKNIYRLSGLIIALFIFTSATARKIPGRIIDMQGRAIQVTFKIPFKLLSPHPNFETIQYRIAYLDSRGKKQVLHPDDAREIAFTYKGEEIRMLSRIDNLHHRLFSSDDRIFLRLLVNGNMKLFDYYFTQSTPGYYDGATGGMSAGSTYTADNYILQKGDGELMQPRGLAFRKDMIAYLHDCPEVAAMVEEKALRRRDMEIIVRQYNEKCPGSEPHDAR